MLFHEVLTGGKDLSIFIEIWSLSLKFLLQNYFLELWCSNCLRYTLYIKLISLYAIQQLLLPFLCLLFLFSLEGNFFSRRKAFCLECQNVISSPFPVSIPGSDVLETELTVWLVFLQAQWPEEDTENLDTGRCHSSLQCRQRKDLKLLRSVLLTPVIPGDRWGNQVSVWISVLSGTQTSKLTLDLGKVMYTLWTAVFSSIKIKM